MMYLVRLICKTFPVWLIIGQTGIAFPQSFVLSNLLERRIGGKPVPIVRIEEWDLQRLEIKKRIFDVMGEFPAQRVALDTKEISKEEAEGYTRIKIKYRVEANDYAVAYLLVPKNIRGKAPAVIAMHPTHPGGKNIVVGIEEKSNFNYGAELAKKGYVVLAPDCITAGERVYPGHNPFVTAPFDKSHPHWSAMGKMVWDHIRALDYLQSLIFVDATRIGAIGHALGGTNAFFLAAFDTRIQATVCNAGFATIAGDANPYRWSRSEWFVFFPELKPYLDIKVLPFDFHEVIALVAPRALLNISGRNDKAIPHWEWAVASALEVSRVYNLYKQGEKFINFLHDGGHEFPENLRMKAYQWLDKWLK